MQLRATLYATVKFTALYAAVSAQCCVPTVPGSGPLMLVSRLHHVPVVYLVVKGVNMLHCRAFRVASAA
jgi:hypothetical protein